MSDLAIGAIMGWPKDKPLPRGWVLCAGPVPPQLIPILGSKPLPDNFPVDADRVVIIKIGDDSSP